MLRDVGSAFFVLIERTERNSSADLPPLSSPRLSRRQANSARTARTRGSCSAAKARCRLTLHASLGVCAVDAQEIDTAKMQVQGQLAAQYIQDVMQVRPEPPPQRRSPRSTRAMCTRSCTLPAC